MQGLKLKDKINQSIRRIYVDRPVISQHNKSQPNKLAFLFSIIHITVTNYENLHNFNIEDFNGIVLDESSILKSIGGKTRNELIERCSNIPFRLCCTATPAPNDSECR